MPPNHSENGDRAASTGGQHSGLLELAEVASQRLEIEGAVLDAKGRRENGDREADRGQGWSSLEGLAEVASKKQDVEAAVSDTTGLVRENGDHDASLGQHKSSLEDLAGAESQQQEAEATDSDAIGLVRENGDHAASLRQHNWKSGLEDLTEVASKEREVEGAVPDAAGLVRSNEDYAASLGQHQSSLEDLADATYQQEEIEATDTDAAGPVPPMPPNHISNEDDAPSPGQHQLSLEDLVEVVSQQQEAKATDPGATEPVLPMPPSYSSKEAHPTLPDQFHSSLDGLGLDDIYTISRIAGPRKITLHHDNWNRMIAEGGWSRFCAKLMQLALSMIFKDCSVLAEHVFSQWYKLRAIYEQHMEAMKKRWQKWTKQKRKDILIEAWGNEGPGIPPNRRSNVDAYKLGLRGNEQKWTYLLPWINLEDLSGKINIPLLIESRANYEPSAFAWSDMNTAWDVCSTQLLIPDALGHGMVLTDQPRTTYGRAILWRDDLLSPSRGHPPLGRGFICLDIQGRILTFLVRICEHLVGKEKSSSIMVASMASSSSALFPPGSAVMQRSLNSVEPQSLLEAHSKARYQFPQKLDLNYLRRLAIAKRDQAYDEIWALREDPSFFHEAVADSYKFHQDWKEHVGGAQENFRTACHDVVYEFYTTAMAWSSIVEDLERVQKLRSKYSSEMSATRPMPTEFNDAVYVLLRSLDEWMQDTVRVLAMRTASNPKIGQFLHLKGKYMLCGNHSLDIRAEIVAPKNMQPPLIAVLLGDLINRVTRNPFGASEIIDDIERIMQDENHKSQKDLINEPTANLLSEIAVFAEIERQFKWHQPKIRRPENREGLEGNFRERSKMKNVIIGILETEQLLTRRCEPLSEFEYPIDECRSSERTRQIRIAEAKLAAVWRYVDQHFYHHGRKTINELLPASMAKSKSLGETETSKGSFALPPRSYKVMAALFPAADRGQDHSDAEEIRWDEFVSALEKMGFSSCRIAGSLMYFERGCGDEKPIMIHRPWPGDEIPAEKLRDHGRRLGWRYGWKRESFRER